MNYRTGLIPMLAAVLTLPIAPARAQVLDDYPPYGAAVAGRWDLGYQLSQQGDFNSAQIQYQRSLDAAQQLSRPHLRDCAVKGSQARIASMEAARAYIRTNGNSPSAIAQAQEVAEQQFRQTIDRLDQERPDLATSCP